MGQINHAAKEVLASKGNGFRESQEGIPRDTLAGEGHQELVADGCGELLGEAQKSMGGAVIRVKGLELGVCLELNVLQCLASLGLVDNASLSAAAVWAHSIALPEEFQLLGCCPEPQSLD